VTCRFRPSAIIQADAAIVRRSATAATGGPIKVHYEIDADATAEQIAALVAQSQKRSAVFDIVTNPTDVTVTTSKA